MNQKSSADGRPRKRPAAPKSPSALILFGLAILASVAGFYWARHSQHPTEKTAAKAPATTMPPPDKPAPPPAPEEPPATPTAENVSVQTPAERLASAVSLLTSPNRDEATAQQARELIDSTYAPLYQQLGLNAADTAAFSNLLMQRLDADRTALAAASNQGLDLTNNPLEVALLVRAATTPVDGQINTLLGNDAYQQYQTFAAPLRATVAAALRQSVR